MPPRNIGIAGFGIAGGALALMLARAGHTVTVIERAPSLGPVGAGFLLQPSGQRVLHRLGLLEAITARSAPLTGLRAFKARGGPLVHLRYSGAGRSLQAYGVHRGLLFDTLHHAALAEKISIRLDSPIRSFRETSDSVFAVTEQDTEIGPFDLLVAADGARSALRLALNPDLSPREYAYGAMWAVSGNTHVRDYLHQVTDGTQKLLGLLPIGGGRCTIFWGLRLDHMAAFRGRGFASWRAEAVRLCPEAEETIDELGSFENAVFTGYQRTNPPRLFSSRMVLIGDAAHAMSPHLGQGANLALLDAECLATELGRQPDLPSAFRAYVRQRQSQNRYYSFLSGLFSPFFQSDSTLLAFGRDLALPVMQAIPPVRWQMELGLAGLKTGFFTHTESQ